LETSKDRSAKYNVAHTLTALSICITYPKLGSITCNDYPCRIFSEE